MHADAPIISEMLAYHFGYGAFGPARRGKRLRPTLVMRVAQTEGAALDAVLDTAAAVEILHNYSLVHDDIEDRDELRHGKPTLWTKYGVAQALNAGDALCALSFLTLTNANEYHPAERVLAMVEALHRAHLTMCHGQARDLQFERESRVGLRSYTEMIAGKTAALFGAACELGAHCARVDADAVARYRSAGASFGLAFQIHDDVQGIWADSDVTGKHSGVDIARRKWTFPVAWALSQPPSVARATVEDAYARGDAVPSDSVRDVVRALEAMGAQEAAREAVAEHVRVIERLPAGGVRDFMIATLEPAMAAHT